MADTNYLIAQPVTPFSTPRAFKAVANGKVYIGLVDTDPVSPVNQIPVYVVNEDGSEVQVVQPIIINAGGFPVYNGQIAKFVTKQNYSMAVYDSYGVQHFYWHDISILDPSSILKMLASNDFGLGGALIGLIQGGTVQDAIAYISVSPTGNVNIDEQRKNDALLVCESMGIDLVLNPGVNDG